jgi:hypothetical protein
LNAEDIIRLLHMEPHPEGGYFAEGYRSSEFLAREALPARYPGPRRTGTAIYYLLTAATFSEIHRVASDEIFHFYLGDPVEMLQLRPDGSTHRVAIGADLAQNMRPQVVVPHGVWQGSRLVPGGRFALLGCTVGPGFEYADYERGSRELLLAQYPEARELILALTR